MLETIKNLIDLEEGKDYGHIEAKTFEQIIVSALSRFGTVYTQVLVRDRGDARRGRIDIVFEYEGERIPIEVDRSKPRYKSMFKVLKYNPNNAFVVTRSPFAIVQATQGSMKTARLNRTGKIRTLGDGLPCPKCGNHMERREHARLTEKLLKKKFYYSEWDVCSRCKHIQHYDELKVYNKPCDATEIERQEAHMKSLF